MYEARLAAIAEAVRRGELEYGPHALDNLSKHGIDRAALDQARAAGPVEIIEDYPEDLRGASCLLLTSVAGVPVHVVISNPPAPFVITVYDPRNRPQKWSGDFRRRMS